MQTIDVSTLAQSVPAPVLRPGYVQCSNGCGEETYLYAGETARVCYSCERAQKTAEIVKQRVEASKKRTRAVFPSHEIAHLWAHQAVPKGRTPSNMSFDGPDFYSYSTVIASIATNPKGKRAYLVSAERYSPSTGGHINEVQSAIPRDAVTFTVPGTVRGTWSSEFSSSDRIMQSWEREVERTLTDAISSREPKKSRLIVEASQTVVKMREFAKFMGLKGIKYPKIPATKVQLGDMQNLIEEHRIKAQAAAEKAQVTRRVNESAARRAQWTKQQEERREKSVESMEAWKRGENVSPYLFQQFFPTLLRVKDGQVETSQGASFPVDHARRGLALVKATMKRGEEWRTNGHTCRLGHYGIDRITADGTVFAGCHVVPFASIEAIEAQLTAPVSAEGAERSEE